MGIPRYTKLGRATLKKSHYFINVVTLQKKSIMASRNPLSFLGLRKRDEPENEEETEVNNSDSPKMSKGGLELNKRGIPARKRKLNSLIYGTDDLVSIPVKSPKKRGPKTPSKIFDTSTIDIETNDSEIPDDKSEKSIASNSQPASPVKSPIKSPVKSPVKKRIVAAKK